VTGTIYSSASSLAGTAQIELTAAYNTVLGLTSTGPAPGDLGGHTYTPGVYTNSSSVLVTGTVNLDCTSNPNGQIIFIIGSTLTAASYSSVNLNNCQASNVFWLVQTSATIGTYSQFSGQILAYTSISLLTGATLQGRALARYGSVSLDTNSPINSLAGSGGSGGSGGAGATPAPSSLILVTIALVCAGIYGARKRLLKPFRRN
jgi:hypothetical protein